MAETESVGDSAQIFDAVFLVSALDNLSKIFLKVCEKKSSTVADKSEFDLIKNNILESFKSFDSAVPKRFLPVVPRDEVSTDVMAKLNELSNQFLQMKQEINARIEKIESSNKPVYNYAAAAKSSGFPSSILPPSKSTGPVTLVDPSLTQSARTAAAVGQAGKPSSSAPVNRASVALGKRSDTSLQAIKPVQQRRLLVNKFHPGTMTSEITDLIGNIGFSYDCVKIDTRNKDLYASFVLSTAVDNYDSLCDPNLWPDGINILEFRGFPKRTIDKAINIDPVTD